MMTYLMWGFGAWVTAILYVMIGSFTHRVLIRMRNAPQNTHYGYCKGGPRSVYSMKKLQHTSSWNLCEHCKQRKRDFWTAIFWLILVPWDCILNLIRALIRTVVWPIISTTARYLIGVPFGKAMKAVSGKE